jgi:deoxyribodipyrimidine photo-lyase
MPIKTVSKKYMRRTDVNLFIFRRDLRIQDNLALHELIQNCKEKKLKFIPIFIFNSIQVDSKLNPYFSKNACEFMIQCLQELNLKLNDGIWYFQGTDIDILKKLVTYYQIDTIAFNTDYTPFAKKRDDILIEFCKDNQINTITKEDYTLLPMNFIKSENETPYEVFTPFYKKLLTQIKEIPIPLKDFNIKEYIYHDKSKLKSHLVKDITRYYENSNYSLLPAGRTSAIKILNKIRNGEFKNYDKDRDYPYLDKTTHLSPYMKFGAVSVREVFDTVLRRHGKSHGLLRELIWREFFANVAFNHPKIFEGKLLRGKDLKWDNTHLNAWKDGKTGFPLIDAAMRQLKKEGFLNNRLRMIIASFAIKDLFLDWRECEKIYASYAVDYDPTSNNAGWQNTVSDPYFRTMNPWLQSLKFDKEALYIKKWIPELQNIVPRDIHQWNVTYRTYNVYLKPIVNHNLQMEKLIQLSKHK